MEYDTIIAGAGIAGATAARVLAEGGRRVLILEKRDHIGGNCYDVKDEHGILIHQYGPHIFHTGDEDVFSFLSRFTDWYFFGHEVVAKVGEELLPIPFNLNTLHAVYPKEKADEIEKKLIAAYGENSRVPILELRENTDQDIREVARFVYEKVFLYYTMKQWGLKPEEVDPEVTRRVPVLISRDNRYFQDKYQGVPREGYTPLFARMLEHENITLRLGTDAKEHIRLEGDQVFFEGQAFSGDVIYTGEIDALFSYQLGDLPYRSLDFQFEHYEQPDFQGHSVVNYTVSEDYTRITEFRHLTGQKDGAGTTIVKEYPRAYERDKGQIPYYAILDEENTGLYKKYVDLLEGNQQFYLLGRLAEYKYYNMDVMAAKAMQLAERLLASDQK